MTSVETSSPLQLALLTGCLLAVSAVVWWFAGFWRRAWCKALKSRSTNRSFTLRQRFAFRHYPFFRHWGSRASQERNLDAWVFVVRACVVLALLIYFLVVFRRILSGPSKAEVFRLHSTYDVIVAVGARSYA